jgi:sugar diacid utilization regulator
VVAGWCPAGAADPSAAEGACVALGTCAADLDGFRTSHHEAMEARRVARLVGHESPTFYEEVALLALLTSDFEQAKIFSRRLLGPLATKEPATERLAETLLTVLQAGGSPRHAAHQLGVHENTVAKRLRAIDEMIGPVAAHSPAEMMAALLIARALPVAE